MEIPTEQEVADYAKANGFYDIRPDKFCAYYGNRNWCTGKPTKQFPHGMPMVNWHLAIVTCSKTTKASRKMHLLGKCECGCGGNPTIVIDGKGYAYEKCLERVKKRLQAPMNLDIATAMIKKAVDKPKREKWKEIQKLKGA